MSQQALVVSQCLRCLVLARSLVRRDRSLELPLWDGGTRCRRQCGQEQPEKQQHGPRDRHRTASAASSCYGAGRAAAAARAPRARAPFLKLYRCVLGE